jgi:hypothetical protein
MCRCGDGWETAVHVAAYCPEEVIARSELPFAMRTRRDFDMAVRDPTKTARLAIFLLGGEKETPIASKQIVAGQRKAH